MPENETPGSEPSKKTTPPQTLPQVGTVPPKHDARDRGEERSAMKYVVILLAIVGLVVLLPLALAVVMSVLGIAVGLASAIIGLIAKILAFLIGGLIFILPALALVAIGYFIARATTKKTD